MEYEQLFHQSVWRIMWYSLEVIEENILVAIPELGITRLVMGIYNHVETAELRTLALYKNNIKSESNLCKYVTWFDVFLPKWMQKILLSGKQTLEKKNLNNSIHCRLEKGWHNFIEIKLAKEDHD